MSESHAHEIEQVEQTSFRVFGKRASRMTTLRKKVFLEELRKHGIIIAAARIASPDSKSGARSSFAIERTKDPEFAAAWDEALNFAKAAVEHELHRRSVEGWEEPVYQRGELVGTIRKYSDRLLEMRVKMLMPQYRERSQVEHAHAGVMVHTNLAELANLSKESREDLRRVLLREGGGDDVSVSE